MNPWINAKVLKIKKWSNHLFTLILKASIAPFYAGQFTKLALYDEANKKKIQRAYSYLNSPNEKNLEIYIVRVLNGKLSNMLYNLQSGDKVLIKKNSFGFFTIDEIPDCETLWMFATGTGIGPYCSILKEEKNIINRFDHIVLIHAVRYQNELVYLPLMQKLYEQYKGKLKIQTIISREENRNSLTGRIPFLLNNQKLEKKIGLSINPQTSHVMLCGNPLMVKDTYHFLKNNRNMIKHLRRKKGNITMENYW
ncbi:MAG: FAD-binding oxidoreductase [Buchnera aphidicola (Brevicoryne brassicae)]|uniref:Flavodoxin/ferredoxin--NADP reductase n=1 Tax=Buchnera aphidicola (Brevicoryne brassicae) TaxID=911343 RepID=A0AAJ5PU14_9GAMM|nr:FAD-binding oxidoreductase [Buchnera aphidicola]QCI20116.1 ferredoxin--NADP(+) reductase [Buchnera aphidicola (Brevicoryne brassicae)]WAI18940.1 MAG: FAD-binding oxidoreductase [Buchnera aphidicola (Brevicoryne brassicae)]